MGTSRGECLDVECSPGHSFRLQSLPVLERTYLSMIRDLTERVNTSDSDALDDEFILSEFLDRYGIRLGQMGNILSQLAPLAEAAPPEPGPAT